MSSRAVSARITEVNGQPREGLLVMFHAPQGFPPVSAMTDASGVFTAELETLQPYRVSVENAVIVEDQHFPAGTVFRVIVPEGEGPASLDEVDVQFVDASRPTLLDLIADLEARLSALETA